MKTNFYSKIAVENIKKNPRLYIPRILSEAGLLGCFYILLTLSLDTSIGSALGGGYLRIMMALGTIILGLLSFVLILYINSFLMKQRKSEYGLYSVLGMEKRHIIKVLFCESAYTSLVSYLLGAAFGIILYKYSSLLICKLLHVEIVAGFYYLSVPTVIIPVIVFAVFDISAYIINSISIKRLNPVDLLCNIHTGEKEPKTRWLLLILGVISLGSGYYIALTTKSPLDALFLFFVAVILVIIGTYFLFITGTIFILKCLRKNKKYYYDKKHMPAVSGLLFRMKQNAVGLASIATLATFVLVMISTTVSLYSGIDDVISENYPQELYLSANYTADNESVSSDILSSAVNKAAKENKIEIEEIIKEQYLPVSYLLRNDCLLTKNDSNGKWDSDEIVKILYITEDTYNNLVSKSSDNSNQLFLNEDEIAFCSITANLNGNYRVPESLNISGTEYTVSNILYRFPIENYIEYNTTDVYGIVVKNTDILKTFYDCQKEYEETASDYIDIIAVKFNRDNLAGEDRISFKNAVITNLKDTCQEKISINYDTKWDYLADIIEIYGTFLFLGMLLGFVCMFSTVLIIYYKQISEGYEDRGRFQIMEKIGMESSEVKNVISGQLVTQFTLPLVTAGIHLTVAFPILLKLLKLLQLSNTNLFIVCSLITFALFTIVYILVYFLTSRAYYRIVR